MEVRILFPMPKKDFISNFPTSHRIPKSRLYVHLSKDEDTAVKVGKRHGKPILYLVKYLEKQI